MAKDNEEMISDLQKSTAYPEPTSNVKFVQTHISWVFICDDFVYKLKKPVNFGFLDFTTLEKRNYYCHQEVLLNQRLAKDVYLGVFPVIFDGTNYRFGSEADPKRSSTDLEPVEYAVKMRVIPDELLLKNRFKNGMLTEDDIYRTSNAIAKFHNTATRSKEIDKFGSLKTVKFNTDENFHQTENFIGSSITEEQYSTIKKWTSAFYGDHGELFQERINAGRVRDCHGDLHMEHICLTKPIKIIDCIEFNQRFRYSDTASDLAFLLMDLEYHNGHKFAELLYRSYRKYSAEKAADLELIVKYYKVYRAYVRGKVTSFRLNDPNISDSEKNEAKNIALKYFKLAYIYTQE